MVFAIFIKFYAIVALYSRFPLFSYFFLFHGYVIIAKDKINEIFFIAGDYCEKSI